MATSQDFVNWVCSPRLDYRFLKYVLLSEKRSYASFAHGTTHQTIYFPEVKAFHICLPPLDTQRKIAAILSAYDDLIDNNGRRVQLLEEMAQRIYDEWFIGFRYPGHDAAPLIATDVGRVPEGWDVGVLADLFVLQRGFDLPVQDRRPGNVPILSATGITGWHDESRAEGPGVVTGRSGSLGTVQFVQENYWPLNTTLWVREYLRASAYLAYFVLRSIDLRSFNSGAAVPTLNRNDIALLPRVLPPSDLVRRFDDAVADLFRQSLALRRLAATLASSRDLLLPRLVSGQINLEDVDVVGGEEAA
jgi:type I restriction enzyme S subunit